MGQIVTYVYDNLILSKQFKLPQVFGFVGFGAGFSRCDDEESFRIPLHFAQCSSPSDEVFDILLNLFFPGR